MAPPFASIEEKLGMSLEDISRSGDDARTQESSRSRGFARKRPHDGGGAVRVGRRCYVGNLSYKTSWQDLKDHFREVGNVVHAKIMEDEDTGSSKGCGIVEFETTEEALEAIEMLHDSELGGRPLIVREDREDRDLKGGGKGGGDFVAKRIRGGGSFGSSMVSVGRTESSRNGGGGGRPVESRRCYVGNLSYRTTWQTLKDHFRQAGEVVYSNVMEEEPGRSKGCGIVEFETTKEAARAIRTLHDSELDGRPILVREDREDKELLVRSGRGGKNGGVRGSSATFGGGPHESVGQSRRCYVGNLSYKTSWQDLKDLFREVGNVVHAKVMKEEDGSARSKGCGIVEFETAREAARAVRSLHDTELDGRPIFVREDREDRETKGKGKGKGKR